VCHIELERVSFDKRGSKFTTKRFYEIEPWSLEGATTLSIMTLSIMTFSVTVNKTWHSPGNTKWGSITVLNLLFDWFGLVCFANKNKNCQLSFSWFQTSQTGGQRYRDTSPLAFPAHAIMTLSTMSEHFYAECHLCWLSLMLSVAYKPLCWVSLCWVLRISPLWWVSLCWMSLCWMSWRPLKKWDNK
jgi:hypothetical protein